MYIFISTHHKTGTVFWYRVFNNLNKYIKSDMVVMTPKNYTELDFSSPIIKANKLVLVRDTHGNFNEIKFGKNTYKAIHSIRNPANLIYSAVNYHKVTHERWANIPLSEFRGLSYKEKINSLDDLEKQLIFEMNHSSYDTIKNMYQLSLSGKLFEIDIDDISSDKSMSDLKNVYNYLEIDKYLSLNKWLAICKTHCLWFRVPDNKRHITTSEPGIKLNNSCHFTEKSRIEFLKLFGEDLYRNSFY